MWTLLTGNYTYMMYVHHTYYRPLRKIPRGKLTGMTTPHVIFF